MKPVSGNRVSKIKLDRLSRRDAIVALSELRVVVAILQAEMDNGVVVADKLDVRLAKRGMEHHVRRCRVGVTMLAIVILGQCERIS